jgi:sec-independent protein translocase protein TatA
MQGIFLNPALLLSMPGESEWLLILLVILLFFGGKKIPDLMKGIGRGVREFNDAKDHLKNELDAGMKEKDVTTQQTSTTTTPPASTSVS